MRFGLSWRAEIGSGILRHLDEIDVVEITAEEFVDADASTRRALRFLGEQVPIVVHATSLGLASTEPVSRKRLDAVARVIGWLQPEFWSEHLAFVRAGGNEIGHLAAPPRNEETLAGLLRNMEIARSVAGSAPLLENIATLVDPPFSTYDEAEWLTAIGSDLLLDLHNLHANATNFGFDAHAVIARIPHERIRAIHLAGGKRIEGDRILDDHLHAVPDEVYALLGDVGAEAAVIIERDGQYPEFGVLLEELRRARMVERRPVERRAPRAATAAGAAAATQILPFLAKLYTDDATRFRFLADPIVEARRAGFSPADAQTLASLDLEAITLAARSYGKKRTGRSASGSLRTSPARAASECRRWR
jgi:uncharacterized protein